MLKKTIFVLSLSLVSKKVEIKNVKLLKGALLQSSNLNQMESQAKESSLQKKNQVNIKDQKNNQFYILYKKIAKKAIPTNVTLVY